MKIKIVAHPNSKREWVEVDKLGVLHVYVMAPAIEGKANMAIVDLLAKHFKVRKSKVILDKGGKSKIKVVEVFD